MAIALYFIGVDLAWSAKNNSATAAIYSENNSGKLLCWEKSLRSNAQIIDFIRQTAGNYPCLVGIDAPLIVPNEKGSRPCDQELTRAFARYHAGTFPANRERWGRIGSKVRGEEIVEQLTALNFIHNPFFPRQAKVRQVIEVYPHPATIVLFNLNRILKYKARPGRNLSDRQKELAKLQEFIARLDQATPALQIDKFAFSNPASLSGNAFKAQEDLLDAILCAYIIYHAWYWGEEGYCIFGERPLIDGYILVPTISAFQSSEDFSGSHYPRS